MFSADAAELVGIFPLEYFFGFLVKEVVVPLECVKVFNCG